MKNKAYVMACIFLCVMLFAVSRSYSAYKQSSERTVSAAILNLKEEAELPDEYEKLLDSQYGRSEHFVQSGDIRFDVERVEKEDYFIKYSWANYDLSNLCFYVFVENSNGEVLEADESITAHCTKGDTVTSTAFYCEINDFPEDDPLKYKKKLIARFMPLKSDAETVDLSIVYLGIEYKIEDIPLTK